MTHYLNSCLSAKCITKCCLLLLIGLLGYFPLHAQVTVSGGTGATAGSPYGTLTAAINAINVGGALTSAVTVNVPAGFTENLAGKITLTQTGTITNTITIQKSGAGINPILTAYTGTVAIPSTVADGFFVLAGVDFVTIDGIDLQEKAANVTTTTVMEFGYGLFKASATDGCQSNTIKNCTITLNRLQNTGWTAAGHNGSVGIAVCNATHLASTALIVTAASGSNSNNKFYTNTIQNCNAGIILVGFAAVTPFTLADVSNDVGGTTAGTGNTVLNYGGGAATNPATGIFANNQWSLNVSNNNLNNNNGSGVNHATTLRGIFLNSGSTSASANVNGNTISVKSGATTSALIGIDMEFGSTAAANTINVNNNIIQNCSYATATTGAFQAILTVSSAAILNVSGNTITSNSLTGTGQFDGITIQSTPGVVTASTNSITLNTKTGTGTMNCMNTTSSITTLVMNTNTISNNSITGGGATTTLNCIRNSLASFNVNNNIISSNSITSMSGISVGEINGYVNLGSSTSETCNNNSITGLSIGGTSTSTAHLIRGIITTSGTTATKILNGNTIGNLAYNGSAGAATVSGIQTSSGGSCNFLKNKIYDLLSNGTGAIVNGINVLSGTTVSISNNLIGHLNTPNATGLNAINGINASGTSTYNIYYNTIYITASSTSVTTFGSSCVTFTSTATSFNSRNNIYLNTSIPAQEGLNVAANGISACVRRSGGTAATVPTNYATTSNNNAYWNNATSGINNHLVYVEGTSTITNTMNTLTDLKTFMVNRDLLSVTENPNFLSLVGTSSTYLHIDNSMPTQLESGAVNITSFATDYDGHIRFGNTGYPGGTAGFPTGGTATDIGADEFQGIFLDATPPTISYGAIASSCLTINRTFNATITDISGTPLTGSFTPRVYYRKNAGIWFSTPATFVSGTATNSTWTFTIDNTLMSGVTIGDAIQYYATAQDNVSPTANVGANPSAGFSASDVNTIVVAPTTPSTYTVTSIPSFSSATPTGVTCNGLVNGVIVVSSSATLPVFTIAPAATQSPAGTFTGLSAQTYTITVTDAGSCSSTTIVTVSQPAVLVATTSTSTNIICNGGSATLNASQSGGTGPYTYQWLNGSASNTINITATKDNTIYGGQVNNSNALGTQILAGQSNANVHRALVAFNVAGSVPGLSTITNAVLKLTVTGTTSVPTAQNVSVHKLLANWGEGTSIAPGTSGIGNLVAATTGDATWLNRFHPSTAWTTAGGTFTPAASATTSVNLIGNYTWSSATLISDVQFMYNNPSSDFGWIVKGVETGTHQARRYGSREHATATSRPTLTVTYSAPITVSTSASFITSTTGTYTLVVTDANGCTNTSTIVITNPPVLTVSASSTTINCNGGSANLTSLVNGGVGPYSYSWNAAATIGNVQLTASKDNSIYESNQNNSNAKGNQILAGNNGSNLKTRALLAFNLSGIPSNSTITSSTLTMSSTGGSSGAGVQNISLHKVLEDWGEGTSNAGANPGNGAAATTNDATWLNSFHLATPWTNLGGTFNATASATTGVNATGPYSWTGSTLTSDVQAWVNNGSSNFGWIIRGEETAAFQAKRFASREETDTNLIPKLLVAYTTPNIISTSANPNAVPAGTYTLVVTDANGCTTSTIITVTQPAPVPLLAQASPDTIVCVGTLVTLTGSGAVSYAWTGGVIDGVAFVPPFSSNYIVTGTDANGCTGSTNVTIYVIPCNADLTVKFFIEGYYLGNSLMTTVLLNTGQETNPLSTNVDTVSVDLHDASFPFSIIETYTGILQTNGELVCIFPVSVIGNSYYIAVRHKNAMETWSANPVALATSSSYDFSTANTQAYGANMKDVFNENIWSIYSGDVIQDGSIDAFDYIAIDVDITLGSNGYLVNDLNGDSVVDAFDYLILDPNLTAGITIATP